MYMGANLTRGGLVMVDLTGSSQLDWIQGHSELFILRVSVGTEPISSLLKRNPGGFVLN
jgi:hypothetical protein